MSVDPSAHLVFGIDFDEDEFDFLEDDEEFWEYEQRVDDLPVEELQYFTGEHRILALKGYTYNADYGSLTTEIESLEVDPEDLKKFMDWCDEVGIEDPQPKWYLTFGMM